MGSDVPIGVSLSGGVDSTIVAAICARATGAPINTYAIGFVAEDGVRAGLDRGVNDDREFARLVAGKIGSRHTEIDVPIGPTTLDDLRRLVGALDEPSWEGSFLSIDRVMGAAQRDGVRVLMTGDGSDELFAGYPWYRKTPVQRIVAAAPGLAGLIATAAPVLRRLPCGEAVIQEGTADGLPIAARYAASHQIFGPDERRLLAGRSGPPVSAGLLADVLEAIGAPGACSYDQFIALADLMLWVREHFNQRLDRMSMRNSVEARVPFQANAVVDLGLGLRPDEKMPGGRAKGLLRDAFRDVIPPEILRRPKRPFSVPGWSVIRNVARWRPELLSGAPRDALDVEVVARTLQSDAASTPAGLRRAWCLLVLCLWLEAQAERRRPLAAPAALTV